MNFSRIFIQAFVFVMLSTPTLIVAIQAESQLSAEQVVDLLMSENREHHRRGVQYVIDHKPELTSQITRLFEGLLSEQEMVRDACCIGICNSQWDPKVMQQRVPELLNFLGHPKHAARRAGRDVLMKLAPDLKDQMSELIVKATDNSIALESMLLISNKVGLSKMEWISLWLPIANRKTGRIGERVRYAIQSVSGSEKILIKLLQEQQTDSITATILEILTTYHHKPKGSRALVVRMLGHESEAVRLAAINALAEIPHDWSLARPELLKIARSERETLRAAAAKRLFADPCFKKKAGERNPQEQQVAQFIDTVFSDDSALVRQAACSGSVFTSAVQLSTAEKLIDLLTDPDADVRLAAHGALGFHVGLAMYALNHDPEKVRRFQYDLAVQQGDRPQKATERVNQMMSESQSHRDFQRALLRLVDQTAESHPQEQVRKVLSQLRSAEAREQARQQVPAQLRLETATSLKHASSASTSDLSGEER